MDIKTAPFCDGIRVTGTLEVMGAVLASRHTHPMEFLVALQHEAAGAAQQLVVQVLTRFPTPVRPL